MFAAVGVERLEHGRAVFGIVCPRYGDPEFARLERFAKTRRKLLEAASFALRRRKLYQKLCDEVRAVVKEVIFFQRAMA